MTSTLSRLSEPSATCLMCSGRLSRPTHCGPPLGSSLNPNLVAITTCPRKGEGFAHKFFVREGAVDFGCVEEGDAAIDGRPEKGDHLLPVSGRTVAKAHPHAAELDSRDFQVATSEFAFLHSFLL